MDYAPIYVKVRAVLNEGSDTLSDTDHRMTLIVKAIVRRFWIIEPAIAIAWERDPANADTDDDRDAFYEFVGWTAAMRIYNLPKAEGDEIINRIKIGQLEITYLRQGVDALNQFFSQQALFAYRTISIVGVRRMASIASGAGMPKVHLANPARAQAAMYPDATGPVSVLFNMPISEDGL